MTLTLARVMIVHCGNEFSALYVNGDLYAEGRKELLVKSLVSIINLHNIFDEASECNLNEEGKAVVKNDGFPTKLSLIPLIHVRRR